MKQPTLFWMTTRRFYATALTCLGLSVLSTVTGPVCWAHDSDGDHDTDGDNAHVFPHNSRPYGLTYGEWQARWWQWSISIPGATHPYVSADFADVNQSGPAWFLVGWTDGGPRDVVIPQGKAIFFPIANAECSNVELPPFFGANEADMRLAARQFIRTDLSCEIDGHPVSHLDRFDGESPLFSFSAPAGNILTGGPAVSGQAVDGGVYLMIAPLSPGLHTLHFKGTQTDAILGSFTFDSTYNILIPHRGKGHGHDH